MTHLETVKPLLFENSLIIALSKDWINQFSIIPQFDVSINKKGRLCIISESSIKKEGKN